MNCLCDSLFIKTLRDQLLYFLTASNASPLSQLIALMCDVHSCFSFPTLQVQIWSSLLSFFFFSFIFLPTEFCMELHILFWWSGTPASSQLVLCEIFCI